MSTAKQPATSSEALSVQDVETGAVDRYSNRDEATPSEPAKVGRRAGWVAGGVASLVLVAGMASGALRSGTVRAADSTARRARSLLDTSGWHLVDWSRTDAPTSEPTNAPTPNPTPSPIKPLDLTGWEYIDWNRDPTSAPTRQPTSGPTGAPSQQPSHGPTGAPTAQPSSRPTQAPTTAPPTEQPTPSNPYFFGDEYVTVPELGIEMSAGLNVRVVAQTGERVKYANGDRSKVSWHTNTDAAGILLLDESDPNQGYVYLSNSEAGDGEGGVHGLYFDKDGNIVEYKRLLTGTTDNCGGGLTPWNTWVSCEEYEDGQCWQVDAFGNAEETKLGGDGGRYESVAVDPRDPEHPVFFTTEDHEEGALRRFVADGWGWDALHSGGKTTFLNIIGNGKFEWTDDEGAGRESARRHFPKTEGIQVHEGKVYFMSKLNHELFILDLETETYVTERTGKKFYGEGDFGDQPDQNLFGPSRKYIYFTEDGGCPGVFARYGQDGTYFTMFQAIKGGPHCDDETVGIAYSPDHKRFYAGIQDVGLVFEFTRKDGLAFE